MRTAPNGSVKVSKCQTVRLTYYLGMSVKRKELLDKGCVPRNNETMAKSIIAIIVVDVSVVTVFNIIGLLFPVLSTPRYFSKEISNIALVATLASGVLLVIMTYQIDQVGARIGRKLETVHKLQTVQRVFGRISGTALHLTMDH